MAVLAAYLWDFAAILLERGHGALRPSELTDATDRELARDLLRRAVGLCFRAAERDVTLARRSPFVRWITTTSRRQATSRSSRRSRWPRGFVAP